MKNNLFNFLLFVILISRIRSEAEHKKVFSDTKSKHDKILTEAAIDLYLPKYNFQSPQKDTYSKIYRYLNDEKKKSENLRNLFIIPDENILEDDKEYKKRIIAELIKKEVNMDETKFEKELSFYGYPSTREFNNLEFKLLPEDIEVGSYYDVEDGIQFDPQSIRLADK
jgi:hypothetical protein